MQDCMYKVNTLLYKLKSFNGKNMNVETVVFIKPTTFCF